MSLLLNKYSGEFIDKKFHRLFKKFNIDQPPTENNYEEIREKIIRFPATEKMPVDFGKSMFVHFTFCAKMKSNLFLTLVM